MHKDKKFMLAFAAFLFCGAGAVIHISMFHTFIRFVLFVIATISYNYINSVYHTEED